MLRSLLSRLGTNSITSVRSSLLALQTKVELLERSEVMRSAEHAAMVDQLDRLYKRISVRIAREQASTPAAPEIVDPEATSGHESVLSLRQRVQRAK